MRYYSGNGDGTFTYVTEISDGTGDQRYSLSAIPNGHLGRICGDVTYDNGDPAANVTVKVIDSDDNQVGVPIVTGPDGRFYSRLLPFGTYSE